jgi:hypothetical protein
MTPCAIIAASTVKRSFIIEVSPEAELAASERCPRGAHSRPSGVRSATFAGRIAASATLSKSLVDKEIVRAYGIIAKKMTPVAKSSPIIPYPVIQQRIISRLAKLRGDRRVSAFFWFCAIRGGSAGEESPAGSNFK